ncbi:MAG TPA: hypothetical protein PLD03_13265 [Thiomonas arsenitoxydans]|nr:hypothetical protein [Thiomonas arsenitoxydans]HRZ38189.1 hypothetical protein [Candidatus Paceibacterota bacterium]HRZ57477.1 hypothetical protein [Candidatus Paceibacterota bacterium]
MKTPVHPTLIQRSLGARQKQLQAQGPVLAASLVTVRRTCGKPSCHCAHGHKHVGHYLTWKEQGKTRSAYVPQALLPQVQQWQHEYRRLKRLLAEVSQLSVALVKTHTTHQRRRAGRS